MDKLLGFRILTVLKRALLSAITLMGIPALLLSGLYLLRYQSSFQRQVELRAQTLANALAGQGQFSLLMGDRAELQEIVRVALAGNEDVLYIVMDDASGQTLAAAWRSPVTRSTLPAGQGPGQSATTRHVSMAGQPGGQCVEASAAVIAKPELFNLQPAQSSSLGRIRIGMSLAAERATFLSTVWYVGAIVLLLFLVAIVIEHSRVRQRLASEKIRKVEDRLQFLVSFSPSVLYSCSASERAPITFIGENIREMLGYAARDFEQPGFFWDHLHPEDEPRVRTLITELLRTGQHTGEYRLLHRNGTYRWIQNHARVLHDAAGEPLEIIGSIFDVTEKMQAEEALRKSDLQYRELTEMLPQTVFECDSTGRLTITNRRGLQSLGLNREDWEAGVSLLEFITEQERPRAIANLNGLFANGESFVQEYTIRRKDGITYPAVIYGNPILTGNKPSGVRGLLVDISERRRAEEASREWAMVLESSNDAIVKRAGESIVFWNAGAERIYGYTREEILGKSIRDITPTERWHEIAELTARLERGEAVVNFETVRTRKDGQSIDVSLALWPIRDSQGQLIGMVGASRDITELKQKQRELLKRNAVLELLQHSASAANQAATVEEAAQTCLERICNFTGWEVGHAFLAPAGCEQGLVSSPCWHFSESSKFAELRNVSEAMRIAPGAGLVGRVLESRAPYWAADLGRDAGISRGKLAVELGLKGAFASPVLAGSEVVGVLEFFCSRVPESDDLFLQAITSIGVQLGRVVERARASEALRESESRFRAITENATHAILTMNEEGGILYANRTAELLFGYSAEEFSELTALELVPAGLRDVHRQRIREMTVDAQENIYKPLFESTGIHRCGREIPLEVSSSGYLAKNNRRVCTTLVRDISERKQLEAQLRQAQKLESIGQLAAGLSHEINTPIQYVGDNVRFLQEQFQALSELLSAYRLVSQAAESGPVPLALREAVRRAAEQADIEYLTEEIPKAVAQSLEGIGRVAEILRAMKEFSHPGTGERTAVDLNHAIESTILVCRNEWKYVAGMQTRFDASLPLVPCFAGEINQVILNLLINAAQAIGERVKDSGEKGLIEVSTRRDGAWAEVQVRDTGTGIPAAIRDRIFDPFFTTKPVGSGTGQGLAIAHAVVVKKHGGSISFETTMGVGTVFTIRLPLASSGEAR